MKPELVYFEMLKYQPENLRYLQEHFTVTTLPNPSALTPAILAKAQVLLAPLGYYLDGALMDQAPQLRVIGSNTTGDAHIDLEAAQARGIKVFTLKGRNDFLGRITPTAEHTWGLLLALTRNLVPALASVRAGHWDRRPFGGARMLSRMSLGVVGCGRLGYLVARYGLAFGMQVGFYDPFVAQGPAGAEKFADLESLVARSDAVSLHVPHEPATEGMISRQVLSRFKPGSFFVNTSRGELVDESALVECLQNGHLAGVAADVLDGEFKPGFPDRLRDHPLWRYAQEHPNVILTPHIGGSTVDAWRETERYTLELIRENFHA